jgi:hypothetical protein
MSPDDYTGDSLITITDPAAPSPDDASTYVVLSGFGVPEAELDALLDLRGGGTFRDLLADAGVHIPANMPTARPMLAVAQQARQYGIPVDAMIGYLIDRQEARP